MHLLNYLEIDISIPGGAEAIVSIISNLLKFIKALSNDKSVTLVQLELIKPEVGNFGLETFRFGSFGPNSLGHTGYINGIFAEVGNFPKEKCP